MANHITFLSALDIGLSEPRTYYEISKSIPTIVLGVNRAAIASHDTESPFLLYAPTSTRYSYSNWSLMSGIALCRRPSGSHSRLFARDFAAGKAGTLVNEQSRKFYKAKAERTLLFGLLCFLLLGDLAILGSLENEVLDAVHVCWRSVCHSVSSRP